jgi:hypothetical protein
VAKEQPESELERLREEQRKTRHDEVFGGLSPAEEADYNRNTERIRELEYFPLANRLNLALERRGPFSTDSPSCSRTSATLINPDQF